MGSGVAIRAAYEKYGIENFRKEILVECLSEEDMYFLERELVVPAYIDKNSYNLMEGGVGGFGFINETGLNGVKKRQELMLDPQWLSFWKYRQHQGSIRHAESISKKEFSRRGVKANKTAKENNGKYSFEGRSHSSETKKIIGLKNSANQKGEKNSRFGSMWITNDEQSKSVPKDSLIPDGWRRGRKIK